jgi:hypothetical protein
METKEITIKQITKLAKKVAKRYWYDVIHAQYSPHIDEETIFKTQIGEISKHLNFYTLFTSLCWYYKSADPTIRENEFKKFNKKWEKNVK